MLCSIFSPEDFNERSTYQASSKGPSRSEVITARAGNQANEQSSTECNDVGVRNVDLGQFEILLNGVVQLSRVSFRDEA